MPKIYVKKAFTLHHKDEKHEFPVGNHTVPADVAEHWYTKAHTGEEPAPSAEGDADLAEKRRSLDEQLDAARADALYAGATGESLLAELAALEADAAATPISGPGIEVTIVEPSPPADLSDVSRPARGSSDTAVLDGDLRVLVNSLWVSGAEAVAVGDVRIGPGVTIRQAGGAMLVDNRPVFSPYTVTAVGSPTLLQTRLAVSDAYLRLSALEQLYRVAFEIRAVPELTMPATVVRTMLSAERGGQP